MMNPENHEVSMRAAEAALGEHPAEVAGLLTSLAESLAQLDAIFSYLQADLATCPGVPPRLRALAGAGRELSGLVLDLADGRARKYRARVGLPGQPPG